MKMGAVNINIGCVDIHDVAEAHYQAGFRSSANGRNIISAENQTLLSLAQLLQIKYGNTYPLPQRNLPKWLVWLMAPTVGVSRNFISTNVNYKWNTDNSKGIKELGINYHPINNTINESFQQLIDSNVFKE